MKTSCRHAARWIQLLLDGRIAPADRDRLDQHLAVCPGCSAALDEYRRISSAAGTWARPSASDDPGDRFTASVLQRIASESGAPALHNARLTWIAGSAIAAAVVLLAAVLSTHIPIALPDFSALVAGDKALSVSPAGIPSFPAMLTGMLSEMYRSAAGAESRITVPLWTSMLALPALCAHLWFARRASSSGRLELS